MKLRPRLAFVLGCVKLPFQPPSHPTNATEALTHTRRSRPSAPSLFMPCLVWMNSGITPHFLRNAMRLWYVFMSLLRPPWEAQQYERETRGLFELHATWHPI